MEQCSFNFECLGTLSVLNEEFSQRMSCYLAKQVWSSDDRKKILDDLADAFLVSSREIVSSAARILGPIMTELIYRCFEKAKEARKSGASGKIHVQFSNILGELCSLEFQHAKNLSQIYFGESESLFCGMLMENTSNSPLPSKRRKVLLTDFFNNTLYSLSQVVRLSPTILTLNSHWKEICQYVFEHKEEISGLGCYALACIFSSVFRLPWKDFPEFEAIISCEKDNLWKIHYQNCAVRKHSLNPRLKSDESRVQVSMESLPYTKRAITSEDLTTEVVTVCGVILPKIRYGDSCLKARASTLPLDVVSTHSVKNCLRSLALAVSNCHPVIIRGPPGCGKSTLIEYLAQLTGRNSSNFVKVQLGEGVDSKVLSGMYKCTAISGEFEWQLGALAEVVKLGHWILLEDVDKAPLDVISLLLPLLENGTLKIPGHHESYDAENAFSSGFRIFMTYRTQAATSSEQSTSPGIELLERHSRRITMPALQGDDLETIVSNKYPKVKHLSSKILEIYYKLEHLYMEISGMDSKTNRRMSTIRDLFRLLNRVSSHLSQGMTDSQLGQVVAMEAVDCLVASAMSEKEQESKIHSVFALLNLSTANAEYFLQSYLPDVIVQTASISFGRVTLSKELGHSPNAHKISRHYALTRSSSILLERVACAIEMCEPVLLVGETGVGKTSMVQYLAEQFGHTLHIVNISQQSSSSDLLGAYKPVQPKHLVLPVRDRFEQLFGMTFSRKQNEKFLTHIQTCFLNKRYTDLLQLMAHCTKSALKKVSAGYDVDLLDHWKELESSIAELKQQIKEQKAIAFTFVEGILSQAIRKGDWLLLDEVNLASPETLDCLSGVLESHEGSVSLLEVGDVRPIKRHANFRIFAAMNPATDIGKKNLPPSIRNRFLELFVPEPKSDSCLLTIISHYLKTRTLADNTLINSILQFYRQVCDHSLKNAAIRVSAKPVFSLRSLCRALRYVNDNLKMPLKQALYEGLCLAFLTEVDYCDQNVIESMIVKNIAGKNKAKSLMGLIPFPSFKYVTVGGYHLRCGSLEPFRDTKFIVTPCVKRNLKTLSRAVSYSKYPILIQGETSTGKTSIIHYMAALSGNKVFRINNHEHTDLQEYIGCYSSDENGKFYFQEGPLVTAMRQGHWVILDELNLAPTDILESLNRVLDDNRELFIAETQETVLAHPGFTLFATQNPPGVYGGRKVLSRALRNRFIELHFGEIPPEEIITILHKRCELPKSRCSKLINVMQELQERRSTSGIFDGKHGFITLRDLFRWAERYRLGLKDHDSVMYDWDQQLADDGYLLLAGRVRKVDEKFLIQKTIEKHLAKKIDPSSLFSTAAVSKLLCDHLPDRFHHVVFTKPMRRMLVMLQRALHFDEPVLLVGETGCGKTTACEIMMSCASGCDKEDNALVTINCHSHTDASDFLGGLRPVRCQSDGEVPGKLFDWVDGPLVQAMLNGKGILVDEISLAEDSVLERLNSVLEPSRKLIVPDRITGDGSESTLSITANVGFQFMATMNPGGDYGKKELSPALRNRLTEIWCTAVDDDDDDVKKIIKHNLILPDPYPEVFSDVMVNFIHWFASSTFGATCPRSIRDVMKWIKFCNVCCKNDVTVGPTVFLIHGALLVFIDGVGSGTSESLAQLRTEAKKACISKLIRDLRDLCEKCSLDISDLLNISMYEPTDFRICEKVRSLSIGPFGIDKGPLSTSNSGTYSFSAPTTSINTFRLLRALQLPNPILLEGSPGVGKTSLVVALAKISGHDIVRINLSEQTDISDLLGADLPVENGVGGQFSWRDGPLLSALKSGSWVVFDELNLASQSVLEGLNSVFDHRNEIFVPELNRTFHVKSDQTRIFACQNPYYQGGGRKGLPKSFLNRFNQVSMEPLSQNDMALILSSQFPSLPFHIISKMVEFNETVKEQVVEKRLWGHLGAPWEFNLRDITRWCELVSCAKDKSYQPEDYMYLIYCERLQSAKDREMMCSLFERVYGKVPYQPTSDFHLTPSILQVGNAAMERGHVIVKEDRGTLILPSMLHSMESLMTCLSQGWMSILTGQSGVGKTTLVKSLATLLGHNLKIFSVNSSMDATELLGGFEQVDFSRHLCMVIDEICEEIMKNCQICASGMLDSPNVAKMLGIIHELRHEKSRIIVCKDVAAALLHVNILNSILDSIPLKFQKDSEDLDTLFSATKNCKKRLELVVRKISYGKGRFEWVDSELIDALKKGDWLLIEGANLCNPSVLDRLNALLEPNGVLSVTERGVVDGSFVEISPHPSFRLILSLDAAEGNLSRAMRNRGIEIHMLSSQLEDREKTYMHTCQSMSWDEVKKVIESRLLNTYLLPVNLGKISSFLLMLFNQEKKGTTTSEHISMVNCIKCSEEISENIRAGRQLLESVSSVCTQFLDSDLAQELVNLFSEQQSSSTLERSNVSKIPSVMLRDIVHDTTAARVFQEAQMIDAVSRLNQSKPRKRLELLAVAVSLFMKLASEHDWQMRLQFLSDHLEEYMEKENIADVTDQSRVVSKYSKIIADLFTCSLYERGFSGRLQEQKSLPWDPRWSRQLLHQLKFSPSGESSCTFNLLLLFFTTKQLHHDCDSKLNILIKPVLERPTEGRKKSKRKKRTANADFSTPNGILIYSSLYHNGFLKLQSLSNPAIAYAFPLYQSISCFIVELIQSCLVSLTCCEETCRLLETISEIFHIWDVFMAPIEFDASSFSIQIKALVSCVEVLTSMIPCEGFNKASETLGKIEKMVASMTTSLGIDWKVVHVQNRIRLENSSIYPSSLPYQDMEHMTAFTSATKLLNQVCDLTLEQHRALEEESLVSDLANEICHILLEIKLPLQEEVGGEWTGTDKIAVISSRLGELEESVCNLNSVDDDQSSGLHEQFPHISAFDEKDVSFSCVVPIFRHTIVQKLLRLLCFHGTSKKTSSELMESSLKAIISAVKSIHGLSAKQWMSIQIALRSLQQRKVCPLISTLMVFLTEIGASEIFSITSKGMDGAGVIFKPYLTAFTLTKLCGMSGDFAFVKPSKRDLPLKELSATSLALGGSLNMPLSESKAMEKRLNLLKCTLWNVSLGVHFKHELSSSPVTEDPNLILSCTSLFHFFGQELQLLLTIVPDHGCPLEYETVSSACKLKTLISSIAPNADCNGSFMEGFYASLLKFSKMISALEILPRKSQNFISHWLEETEVYLTNALQCSINLLQSMFFSKHRNRKTGLLVSMSFLARSWIWCSTFAFTLSCPQAEIDSAQIYESQFNMLKHHVQEVETELAVYSLYQNVMTGRELYRNGDAEIQDRYVHPLLPVQYRRMLELRHELSKTRDKTAYRPSSEDFKKLVKHCRQLCESTISVNNLSMVLKPHEDLMILLEGGSGAETPNVTNHIEIMKRVRANLTAFSRKLWDFPAYPDYCVVLEDLINHICFGVNIAENTFTVSLALEEEASIGLSHEEFLCSLLSIGSEYFPNPGPIIRFAKALELKVEGSGLDEAAVVCPLVEDVVITLLLRLRNIILFEGSRSSHLNTLLSLLDYVVSEWSKQKERKTQKEEEKASIYKVKQHLHDVNQEAEDEREFQEIFGIDNAMNEETQSEKTGLEESHILRETPDQKKEFSEMLWKVAILVHKDVMAVISYKGSCAVSNSDFESSNSGPSADLPKADGKIGHAQNVHFALPSFYAICKVGPHFNLLYDNMLNLGVDQALLDRTSCASKWLTSCLNSDEMGDSNELHHNIYHDTFVSETKKSLPLLTKLHQHVCETLLKEWPDHPVLLKIIETVSRICSFSVTSPIIKFVSGLEILLGLVQEWEKNASSNVSLQIFINDLTNQVITWRKMELKNWSRLIEDEFEKQSAVKSSVYFALYQLLLGEIVESSVDDVVKQLENFIESSSIAQFNSRLETLHIFTKHLIMKGMEKSTITTCLKNLYFYYLQFSEQVASRIDTLRKPVEKELKDFVKITKWNDQSFFALKSSVEKTHRHLFKLVKKFAQAMQEKVQCKVLVQGTHASNFCPGAVQRFNGVSTNSFHTTEKADSKVTCSTNLLEKYISEMSVEIPGEFSLLHRLPSILKKMKKVCSNHSTWQIHSESVSSVEDFIVDIIENANHLKDLQPTTVAKKGDEDGKAKRLSEAKNIKLRKQKALTDLFKHLSQIGLSYRKGMVYGQDLSSNQVFLTPVCGEVVHQVKTSMSSPKPGQLEVVRMFVSAESSGRDYFYSNILKWSAFTLASNTPHKDLTKGNLDRARGFMGHLMKMSLQQRFQLSEVAEYNEMLKIQITMLQAFANSDYHTLQDESKKVIDKAGNLVNDWCLLLQEFSLWMDCCPREEEFSTISLENPTDTAKMRHGDAAWLRIMAVEKISSDISLKVKCDFEAFTDGQYKVIRRNIVKKAKENIARVSNACCDLFNVCEKEFCSSSPTSGCPEIMVRMAALVRRFRKCEELYRTLDAEVDKKETVTSQITCSVMETSQEAISAVLVSIQNLKKVSSPVVENEKSPGSENKILEFSHTKLCDSVASLNLDRVTGKIEILCQLMSKYADERLVEDVAKLTLPVATELLHVIHSLITYIKSLHRTTSKLCYVLGGIFTQLCQNGFCTPSDVEEELTDGEGHELEDAEGGGVGEGEGSNDVSDQIEDQEMLEDKPGEQQQDDGDAKVDPSDKAIEMDDDFEGNFDDGAPHEKSEGESDDEEEEQERDIKKQMGDLENDQEQDKLDEQFWGSDEDEDEEEDEKKGSEDKGKGVDKTESQLGAKDDDLGNEDQSQDELGHENKDDDKPFDDSQFNPDESDPFAEQERNEDVNEDLDLDKDTKMDDEDVGSNSGMDEHVEEQELTNDEEPEMEEPEGIPDQQDDNGDTPDEEIDAGCELGDKLNDVDDEGAGESDEESCEGGDFDTKQPLVAEENSAEASDNTISDKTSKNAAENQMNTEETENVDSDVPPKEDVQPQEFRNEGNAPTDEWDDASQNTASLTNKSKSDVEKKPSTKRRDAERDSSQQDAPDLDTERRLNIVDPVNSGTDETEKEPRGVESDAYQHIASPTSEFDKKAFDSVQNEQHQEMELANEEVTDENEGIEELMDFEQTDPNVDEDQELAKKMESDSSLSLSEIHTDLSNTNYFEQFVRKSEAEIDASRKELENQLQLWRQNYDVVGMREAELMWDRYCNLTRPLAVELCEQLRLVLEPTQASQLKGDYRTGKRLNIRKLIPYIASGFRKDKIWLRRTKPKKRTYQVMLAIDDSSSMVDNHSKQLAFESVAVISSALSSLEVGELSVCSFGEEVKLLQNFNDTWTTKSGASLLARCSFNQKKTKIVKFLDYSVDLFQSAQRFSSNANSAVSQLLLIISDGRGLYLEGRKRVLEAVASVHKARIFVAFIILDQPNDVQGSITEIKVPVFHKPGEMPEIRSYMKDFPFPYYVILRNINVLPQTLGEALRQWFVLVSGND